MLINVPDYEGLNDAALSQYFYAWAQTQCIASAFYDLFPDEKLFAEERQEYIEQCQRDLRVYFSIIQQCNELALKARLCQVSPYLLLIGSDSRFSSHTDNIDFSSLRTLNAVDLIGAVNLLTNNPVSEEFKTLYNHMRVRRNAMMHLDASGELLEPDEIMHLLVKIYLELWPDRNWLADRVQFGAHGYEAYFDDGKHFTIIGSVIHEWSSINDLFTKGEFKKLFQIPKSKRRYICFQCMSETERGWDNWDYGSIGLAHLVSKTKLKCLLCENEFRVKRTKCPRNDECEGDVVAYKSEPSAGSCHTCSYHPSEI